jgi:hypothetical protein
MKKLNSEGKATKRSKKKNEMKQKRHNVEQGRKIPL